MFMVSSVRAEESSTPVENPIGSDAELIPGSEKARELRARGWRFGSYLDLGYTENFNDPENGLWRSKGTTFRVDDPRVNMALGYLY
jgi:hypothetical protein